MTRGLEGEAAERQSGSCDPPNGVRDRRRRPSRRVVAGHVLGFVVGLGWFLYFVLSGRASEPNHVLFWGLLLLFGFVATVVALAVSYTSMEWRKARSRSLVLRAVAFTLIYSATFFLVYELVCVLAVLEWVRDDYGG
jgi:hypothetical protein